MASTRNKYENDNQISNYVLDELLVEQAASAVYLAKNSKTDEAVFLVTLNRDAIRSGELTDRFQRRVETLAQLSHPALLPVEDYGAEGKRPYVVMPYRSGQFLSEKLETAPQPEENDKNSVVAALTLVKQLASGLSVTHPAGLIHHDLRPENIFIDEAGQPYLLDLAVPPLPPVAAQIEEAPPTELDYQSPEQKSGKALSGRSNIFSLGVLLYRLLAGHKPALPVSEWDIFEYKGIAREIPLNKVRTDLTRATYTAVQNSMWQKEWSRYETINDQIEALEKAIAKESAPPPPPPPIWLKLFNRLRQPKTLRYVIAAVALLFLLLLILLFLRGRGNRQQNITPSPEAINLPVQAENLLEAGSDEPGNTLATSTPTLTATVNTEEAASEDEVLPPVEEVGAPTVPPSETATAVSPTPTETSPTASPTFTITSTSSPSATPTPESTQTNCVPSPPFGWVLYTIQADDSLSSLSEATGTTVERIQEVNCLDTILLSIGQQIWLPSSANPTETATLAPTDVPPGDNNPPPPPPPTSGPPSPTAEPPTPTPPAAPTP